MDLSEMDPARIEDFQTRDPYLRERCAETLVLTYAMHWPGRQRETVRGLRRTPFHHKLKAMGAVHGEVQGWERPAFFVPEGAEPVFDHSFHRPSWFEYAQAEQKAARENVVLFDYSMLGKLMVEGRDAGSFLQRVCTNDMAMPVGGVAYSLMLNERGGIESDVTVARHGDDSFMVMSGISHTRRDRDHLRRHITDGEDVRLRDVTTSYAVLAIAGPRSPVLLGGVMDIDISDGSFPSYHLRHANIGHAPVFAQRLSFTGETGWEIFVTPDFAEHVLETILEAGRPLGLRLAGSEALNALRIEKGFLHWGADMAYTETPHQMGLDFICKPGKRPPFIGRDVYLARKAGREGPYLCSVRLADPEAILHHNEPVLRDGNIIGFVTSGAFCAAQNAAVGLCLVSPPEGTAGPEDIEAGQFAVMVEGHEVPAELRRKPFGV
jgi:4-methylaminobutanoate oxidase (formaldehyde-forming)